MREYTTSCSRISSFHLLLSKPIDFPCRIISIASFHHQSINPVLLPNSSNNKSNGRLILFENPVSLGLDTHETSFVSGLVPVLEPVVGADTDGPLSVDLALVVAVSSLLHAEEPLVVTIPAVQGLVLGRETLITGGGAYILHLMQQILLLLGQFRDLVAENLYR